MVFQQDGASAHSATTVRNYLDVQFPNRWIGRLGSRNWAPRSPDLTPLNFFVWGHIKSKIYTTSVSDIAELKARIIEAAGSIAPEMLENVSVEVEARFRTSVDRRGGHVELNR